MARVRLLSERIGPDHRLDQFESGERSLDEWLVRSAVQAQAMRTAQTFVWHEGDGAVVAYFSLAAHLVLRADLPRRTGHGSPSSIPAVLLARLALHRRLQHRGLGGELLWDALSRAVQASQIAAARVVIVDAIHEAAASFYAHHGFVPVPGNAHRLVQKVSDIALALKR